MPNNEDYKIMSDAIDAATHTYVPLSSRSDVIDYYQEKHGTEWKDRIVDKIASEHPDMKRASIRREFQYDKRLGRERYQSDKMNSKTRERYSELGKELPPKKVPKNVAGKSAKVHFQGTIWISKKSFYKDFTKSLSEHQTSMMLEGNIESIVEAYGIASKNIEDIQLDGITITFDD